MDTILDAWVRLCQARARSRFASTHLKLDCIRRGTAARAPLASVLQFVAYLRQRLLTRKAGYLHGAQYRAGMTTEPGTVSHLAESASCFHEGSPFCPSAIILGWPSSNVPRIS